MLTVGIAGCGGEDMPSDPEAVLEETSAADEGVNSGVADLRLELRIDGVDIEGSTELTASGPFQRSSERGLPELDMDAGASLRGFGESDRFELGVIAAANAGYIQWEGRSYELDDRVFERLAPASPMSELDPAGWIEDPSIEGTEKIEGTETVHVSGRPDPSRMLPELQALARQLGFGDDVAPLMAEELRENGRIDLYSGVEDRILRRFELGFTWHGKLETGAEFGGSQDFSLTLSEVNEPQPIEAPAEAVPADRLRGRLPSELFGLGEWLGIERSGPAG